MCEQVAEADLAHLNVELRPWQEVRVGVNSPSEILHRYQENNYLFFKGVLNPELVHRVKADAMTELKRQGVIAPNESEPVARPGATAADIDDGPIYSISSYDELMRSPELQEAVDLAYGEKSYIAPSVGFRYAMPSDGKHLTPPHQDHFYIQETNQFRMIWVPLMDLAIANGGLAIAVGSEKHGLIDHVELPGVFSTSFKGRPQKGVPWDQVDGVWSASPFEVGDFIMWNSCAVHRSLPNLTDRIRLSLNVLTYPARLPKLWQAERSIPELQRWRAELKTLCDARGLDGDRYEQVALEGMKSGNVLDFEELDRILQLLENHSSEPHP